MDPTSMTARNVPVSATTTIATPAVAEKRRTARTLTSEGWPRTATIRASRPPIQTPAAATSTHIDAAAPMPATATATSLPLARRTMAAATPAAVNSSAVILWISTVPNDVENTDAHVTPAAWRSASTTPAMPSAATTHRAIRARVANGGTVRSAIRQVDATPTMPIKPMKNNHRLTTAKIDGGGDTTDRAACALALVADTPTPNAYAPVARWPSTSETVFQVTVYTPVSMGLSGTSSSRGCPGTAAVGPASTLNPEPLTTVMLESRGSGVSPKVISTSAGALCTCDPSAGIALCGRACADTAGASTKAAAPASAPATARARPICMITRSGAAVQRPGWPRCA